MKRYAVRFSLGGYVVVHAADPWEAARICQVMCDDDETIVSVLEVQCVTE
jgi:hypothetical protein